ncbi:ribosomal protection-like ABC-F family protein [Catenulispora subtropica]|uniref:ABC-F family ATP-binding cassette domain-containing protein n=1 Tax=Catenulispora subtropica TaxID=450798 RepID=A0ABP5DVN6_9ACTN
MPAAFLKVENLSKSYDAEPLFRDVAFVVGAGDRIGLVGPNGVGKSTLLRCLTGQESPSSGRVTSAPHAELGFFAQQVPDPDALVGDFLAEGLGEVHELGRRMEALASRLADGTDSPDSPDRPARSRDRPDRPDRPDRTDDPGGTDELLAEYGEVQDRWTALQGWLAESRLAEVRDRLDIAHLPADTPLARVSGGEQARLMLGRLLLRRPDILVLDEPTNHLDAAGVEWLASYLADFSGGILMVTHDRAFLDRVATRIFELDGVDTELQTYEGGYTAYRAEKARRWASLLLDYEAQEKYRRRLEADIEDTKSHSLSTELATRNDHWRRIAKKVAKKAKAREKRLERQIQSMTWIAEPQTRPALALAFPDKATSDDVVLAAKAVSAAFGGRPVLDRVDVEVRGGDWILVSGRNGAGKTTLLRILAGQTEPDEGSVLASPGSTVAVLPQTHDLLRTAQTVFAYFRSQVPVYPEDAEQLLGAYLFGPDDWSTPLRDLSAGELRRLLLAVIVNSPARVLLLDEPTNYLDFDSLDVVEQALREFTGTVLMVTHDAYFAERVGYGRVWEVRDGSVVEHGDGAVR